MHPKRILELAAEELQRKKADIDAEIKAIRAELEGAEFRAVGRAKSAALSVRRRKPRTLAYRRAQSQRMKEYWAARRLRAAKPSVAAKTAPASAKRRPKTAAHKKALSRKMKEVWKKRKAEAAKKADSK